MQIPVSIRNLISTEHEFYIMKINSLAKLFLQNKHLLTHKTFVESLKQIQDKN